MATAQINVRVNADLKAVGDRALEGAGYSPTRAIRTLWTFAARNVSDLKKLREALETLESGHSEPEECAGSPALTEAMAKGPLIIECALREMGVESYAPSTLSDKELLEIALAEKMEERGLL